MYQQIDIAQVVAIAAVLTMLSLALSFLAMRRRDDRAVRLGMGWLFLTNLCFLGATAALLSRDTLPFWVTGAVVIAGPHLGILCGYGALSQGLDHPPRRWLMALIGVLAIGGQAVLALIWQDVTLLFVSSSVVNGPLGLVLALRLWPRARSLGRAQAYLATLPFIAVSLAYLGRLPVLLLDGAPESVLLSTVLIAFLLAFSALQWCFALIAFAAARLNLRLRAERERADRANRLKSQFLSNMSHELRTPLNGILGMAQALDGELPDGPGRDMLRSIERSGEDLLRLLTDLLDLAHLESGRMGPARAPMIPATVLDEAAQRHRPAALARGLHLSAEHGPGLNRLHSGDAARLATVLDHLLGNAVKFTHAGGVSLSADLIGGPAQGAAQGPNTAALLRIRIRDTGIGMTDAQRAEAFEPFVQADGGTDRRHGGAGVGLAIVQRMVALMGGTIEIDSTIAQGTTTLLCLPLGPAEAAVPQPPTRSDGDRGGTDTPAPRPPAERTLPDTTAHPSRDRPRPAAAQAPALPDRAASPRCPPTVTAKCPPEPRAPDPDPAPPRQPGKPDGRPRKGPAAALQGLRLLLAEDNLTNQRVVMAFLRDTGADLTIVANGREALEHLEPDPTTGRYPFDLLLFDVAMPEMDGPTALRRLRSRAANGPPPPPAIALTANVAPDQQDDYRDAGFLDCLPKPVRRVQLLAAIARHARTRTVPDQTVPDRTAPDRTLPDRQAGP